MAHVLVIDDDEAISRLYARWLSDSHVVAVVGTAKEALARILAGERFDTIVCDVNMPGMSGFEFHAAASRIDAEQARRVVFVTAGPSRVGAPKRPNLPNPLLFKPFRADELRTVVETFLPIRLSDRGGR
jgi:CheY-like chemotaxis protein